MSPRQFAPGEYGGTKVEFDTAAKRRALIGKRIGYDVRGSCLLHRGTVTDAARRSIEIDGNWYDVPQIEKIEVLP